MKKQTKVLLAAALFTLGASFSAMAAEKGTWVLEEDGWYCYDEDGVEWTDTFCLSYGTEYWVDEDGLLGSSMWVEYGDNNDLYYIGSDGTKTINNWRYVLPMDPDDDDEEAWYYFDSKGKMVHDKRVLIGDDYYYFDKDGKMLTGWIEYNKDAELPVQEADDQTATDYLIYANETGDRAANMWLHTYKPGVDEDDADEDDMVWYYITSTGKVTTGKDDIGSLTYIFDKYGVMQTGWVGYDGSNYATITNDVGAASNKAVYFVGDEETGYVRKNGWRLLPKPADYEDADEDTTTYWYYINSNGKVFVPELASDAVASSKITFKNGEKAGEDGAFSVPTSSNTTEIKKINSKQYLFNANGEMQYGIQKIGSEWYYFGKKSQGNMQTGNVTIADSDDNSYSFYFAESSDEDEGYIKGAAVSGNANGYLYVNGLLVKSEEKDVYKVVETENGEFIVNYVGKIQHRLNKEYDLEDGTTITVTEYETEDGVSEYSLKDYETN